MGKLPDILKKAKVIPSFKKDDMNEKKTTVLLVNYSIYQKYLENLFTFILIHI